MTNWHSFPDIDGDGAKFFAYVIQGSETILIIEVVWYLSNKYRNLMAHLTYGNMPTASKNTKRKVNRGESVRGTVFWTQTQT